MKLAFIGLHGDPFSAAVLDVCTAFDPAVVHLVPRKLSTPRPGITEAVKSGLPWSGEMTELAGVLTASRPDLLVVAGCPYRLPESVLRIPTGTCLNVHPSLLPHYRGANPIFWQYQRCDLRAGVTVHKMDPGIDTGNIVCQRALSVTPGSPLSRTVPKYCILAAQLMRLALRQFCEHGTLRAVAQPKMDDLFYARTPRQEDFSVDWERWPLKRVWHFLRMSQAIADRVLPRVNTARRWRVGRIEETRATGAPGTIAKSLRKYWVNHAEGRIQLYSEPVEQALHPSERSSR